MRRVKIVHTADLHFDTPFNEVDEKQRLINKEELKEVFKNIINFCKEKYVDILLLAGDIFDNLTLSRETIYFIENVFNDIKETRVFISPGNDDPYDNNSFYKRVVVFIYASTNKFCIPSLLGDEYFFITSINS